MKFSDISLKVKIFLMLAMPVAGVIIYSTLTINESYSTKHSMAQVEKSVLIATNFAALVHEIQKERGMTAGWIGSKGKKFEQEIVKQRQVVNVKIDERQKLLQNNAFKLAAFGKINKQIKQHLNKLQRIRQQVDQLAIELPQAITYYTQLNTLLLKVSSLIPLYSQDADIVTQAIAYHSFLQGKERAGIERAVLSNTFVLNKFDTGMLAKFITLKSQQETYFSDFSTYATAQNRAFLKQQLDNPAVIEVERLKSIAATKTEAFDIDALYWYQQATLRIGQLKHVENRLSESLISLANDKMSSSSNLLLLSSLLSFILLALTALISVVVIQDIVARVNDISAVLLKAETKNDLTARTQLMGDSELGGISGALNKTLLKFSAAIEEISDTSHSLAAGAEQTSLTCAKNSRAMGEQQSDLTQIASAVEQISMTVKEVAANTQLAVGSAEQADSKSKQGLEVVQKSYRSIELLEHEIKALAATITKLHDSSNNINSVMGVIRSVAEQTNLLALNAAIEAARAGEQGRGFAVVADEVRTLAQRTQQSTTEIENFIETLQSDANSAFSVIEASQKKAQDAVLTSKNVELTLSDISGSVTNIFSMTENISVAAQQQASVTEDIANNLNNIEQKSQVVTLDAAEIASTAVEQAHLAQQLRMLAEKFKV